MMEFVAERSDRLDRELMLRIPGVTRSRLATFIADGGVTVNGEVVRKAGFALKAGMTVTVAAIEERAPQALEPVAMALDVRYEDEALLVVNKTRGLMVHPSGGSTAPTLVHGLLAHRGHPERGDGGLPAGDCAPPRQGDDRAPGGGEDGCGACTFGGADQGEDSGTAVSVHGERSARSTGVCD